MIPQDFAATEPRRFTLPEELSKIEERYAPLGPSTTLDEVFKHVMGQGAVSALLEHEYVDGDFRDEYANFYIRVFRRMPDRCERLHFWSPDRYLGYCSIRPVEGQPVCRTMLDPGDDVYDAVSCLVPARANPYGQPLTVEAFPFISQDQQYGRCAHAVLWMISHYHHVVHDTPSRSMSDIVNAAAEDEVERVVPSRGLTEEQTGATLRRIGLAAVKYKVFGDDGDVQLGDAQDLVLAYLNSRIPVALGKPGHLTALIGARRLSNGGVEFIRSDDEEGPYCLQKFDVDQDSEDRWTVLYVPLPGRIYLLWEEVRHAAQKKLVEVASRPEAVRDPFEGRRVRFRSYVVDSRDYKTDLPDRGLPGDVADRHLLVSCPRWIWVTEVQDEDLAEAGEPSCLGEIAIDATSNARSPHFLFANFPGLSATWRFDREEPEVRQQDYDPETMVYETGTALGL